VVVTVTGTANNPVPTLTSLNPNSAAAGGPGFFLAATGTNFISGSVLRWNGANLATNFISGTQLTAPVPPADIASAGTASITVVNPTPGGGTSNALTFAITAGTGTVNGPFMVQQPSANPNPVNGAKSTQLNVLGGTTSNGGESVLTYTWITAGPAPVNLSANGTNAAKNATAAFTMLGTYTFIAHIVDTVANASIDSNLLSVTVNPGVASIAVSPKTQILGPGQIFNFIATVLDQFGAAFNTLVTWSTSAGAISLNSGAYTAPLTSQTGTVTATAQGKSDSAQVTILLGGAGGVSVDLSNAKVFPVPFKSNAGLPGITFSKLAPGSHIRLFTMTGRLVQTLDSPTGADVLWTLNNADNKRVASGVYLYIIEGAGQKKEGKIVVIQ
jgi:hypothetical protein